MPTPAPAWVVWTNRAVLTFAGTTAAVVVADYAAQSGQTLDLALVAAIIASTIVAVARPTATVPVLLACLLSMLGLAIVPPAWLLSLVPPVLLTAQRRRRRPRGLVPPAYGPDDDLPADDLPADDLPNREDPTP